MKSLAELFRERVAFDSEWCVEREQQLQADGRLHYENYVPDFADGVIYEGERRKPIDEAVARVIEALEFYDSKQEWQFYCSCCADGSTPLEQDHGKKADAALAALRGVLG